MAETVVQHSAQRAVAAWRTFASKTLVSAPAGAMSWTEYLKQYPNGRADERTLVGPVVFPRFVEEMLGYRVGQTLAAEVSGPEGRPDFTPADAATHPFVFEVKGTDSGGDISGHESQITRYLRDGGARIRRVVVTNLSGLHVYAYDHVGSRAVRTLSINLRALASIPQDAAAAHPDAQRLADFITDHRFNLLSPQDKIARVRTAPAWNPGLEATSTDWVLQRLDSVVEAIRADVTAAVAAGHLSDPTRLQPSDRPLVLRELHELDKRVGSTDTEVAGRTLEDYLKANPATSPGLAMGQYVAHTAFYTATRLLLVRAWEDGGLLKPALLYNGGFDSMMEALDNIGDVVETAYVRAGHRYPNLFRRHNAFSWYRAPEDVYATAIYDLANTYLGDLSDDVLGEVYQRQLARVDRKRLGQYYTPRDVISLMWDLVDVEAAAVAAEQDERPLRVLDIATGSGGFLVHGAGRLRRRYQSARAAGATLEPDSWLSEVAEGLIGCEISQFSAYLAEVNLVLQFSPMLKAEAGLRLPPLRVHCADTLTLHNPDEGVLLADKAVEVTDEGGLSHGTDVAVRQDSMDRLRDPGAHGEWLDIAIGNPPYVGEKSIAVTMKALQAEHPYWRQFAANHTDYLYSFLILGVSKLRLGGRFAFITTEYWLKATGAAPLRGYLATHTRIDRLILFRDMTLFPDAPGQHNLIVVGERITDPDTGQVPAPSMPSTTARKPQVSVYVGPTRAPARAVVLDALRHARNRPSGAMVATFVSQRDPASLGRASWAEVTMTREQVKRRNAFKANRRKATLVMAEGVIAVPQRLPAKHERLLSAESLAKVGGPDSKPGVFLLTAEEQVALQSEGAPFTEAEQQRLRAVVNTKDVYPYGVVLGDKPDRLIWLPKTDASDDSGTFPSGLPTLGAHLQTFRPVLERVVGGYKESRPWWSAHRPRTEIVGESHEGEGDWADYAVTARWGNRRLVTALAPFRSVPASGLHALTGAADGTTSAAYLVGLINSTPAQDLAEALAPGSVGQGDISALGIPQFSPKIAHDIEERVLLLTATVRRLVTEQAPRWPLLPDVLHADISLRTPVDRVWRPASRTRGWGTLKSVAWVTAESGTNVDGTLQGIEQVDDLLGRHLRLDFERGGMNVGATEDGDRVLDVLEVAIRGAQHSQDGRRRGRNGHLRPKDVEAMPLPIDMAATIDLYETDAAALKVEIETYQRLRAEIDDIVLANL